MLNAVFDEIGSKNNYNIFHTFNLLQFLSIYSFIDGIAIRILEEHTATELSMPIRKEFHPKI